MSTTKKIFIACALLQVVILLGIIARFEYLKSTAALWYMPITGYDPTDIFRGDYVNVAYELPLQPSVMIDRQNSYRVRSLRLEWSGSVFTSIAEVSTGILTGPNVIRIESLWLTGERVLRLQDGGNIYTSVQRVLCDNKTSYGYSIGQTVYYKAPEEGIGLDFISSTPSAGLENGVITTIGDCRESGSFSVGDADRYFVSESTGLALEDKIRKGGMYARWYVATNGSVILDDIVPENAIIQ